MDHMGFNPNLARNPCLGCILSLARTGTVGFNSSLARIWQLGFNSFVARIPTLGFIPTLARISSCVLNCLYGSHFLHGFQGLNGSRIFATGFNCSMAMTHIHPLGFKYLMARNSNMVFHVPVGSHVQNGLQTSNGSHLPDGFQIDGGSHSTSGFQMGYGSHLRNGLQSSFGLACRQWASIKTWLVHSSWASVLSGSHYGYGFQFSFGWKVSVPSLSPSGGGAWYPLCPSFSMA